MRQRDREVLGLLGAIRDGDAVACRALDDLFAEAGECDRCFRACPGYHWWPDRARRDELATVALRICKQAGLVSRLHSSLDIP